MSYCLEFIKEIHIYHGLGRTVPIRHPFIE